MKSVNRSFRLAAEIFSPRLLIVVVLAAQYIANLVIQKRKLKLSNQKKDTNFYFSLPNSGNLMNG